MAAAAISNFEKLMPLLQYFTSFHQIWWDCYDLEYHIYDMGKSLVPESYTVVFEQSNPILVEIFKI